MSKRPAFQFYPSDWRNDAGLRLCSIAARGLWVEMLCLMHDGAPYGHLTVLGRSMSPESLARLAGESATAVKRWLSELEENAVFSRTDEGVIFSRRMVRDEGLREARAAGGAAGADHGHKGGSHGHKGGRPRKEKPPSEGGYEGGFKPSPSSSSPSPSPPSEHSDADASGGPPPDPSKVMFDSGLRLLASAGIGDAKARPILGKWKRDYGDEAVIAALGAAQREGAIDPVSFITAALEARNGQRPHHSGRQPREDAIFAARRNLGIDDDGRVEPASSQA